MLDTYEKQYGITRPAKDANVRMVNLLRTLHKETGKRVVVLVDEYDSMMLHSIGDAEKQGLVRNRFQNVFGTLKAEDDHLQFVFIWHLEILADGHFQQAQQFGEYLHADHLRDALRYQ